MAEPQPQTFKRASTLQMVTKIASGEAVVDAPEKANSKVSITRSQTHNLPLHIAILFSIAIPCIVATINFCMVAFDLQLITFKFNTMQGLMSETGSAFSGVLALAGIGALYAFASAALVLFLDPPSAGSGIPECKGYMNGNPMPGFFSFRGLFVRAAGVILTVAAGFPVGREGPMVSIGACVGYGVVYLLAKPYMSKWVKINQDSENKEGLNPALVTDEGRFHFALRIGATLGSSAGIATAFNAPIGGILYMFEEVTVTSWAPETTFKAFVGSVVATFISKRLMETLGASAHSLLIFDPEADPTAPKFGAIDWLFVAIAAAVIGFMSAMFAKCLARVWAFRKRISTHLASKGKAVAVTAKLVEAMFYAALCAIVFGLIPMMTECYENPSSGSSSGGSMGSSSMSSSSGSDHRRLAGLTWREYDCGEGSHNKMATLLLTGAEGAVKHLFDQGDASYINPLYLFVTLIFYFVLACGMPGLQVPMGCFVPSMLIGALSGRLFGELFAVFGASVGLELANPGIYAMAGAAAFLGGFTHMTLAITALLVEAARDLSLIPMMMLSISVAHVVSTRISHHGYDEVLIHKKGVPFLDAELPHEMEHGQCAVDLMEEYPDEVLLPQVACLQIVQDALEHDIEVFPVVDEEGVCLGTVSRSRLEAGVIVQKGLPADGSGVDTATKEMAASIGKFVRTKSMTDNGVKIPVGRLMDRCPHTILEDMPVPRFYQLFALGGITNAAVVSKHGEFRGVISRRNLISAAGRQHAPHAHVRSVSGSNSPTNQAPVLLGNVTTGDNEGKKPAEESKQSAVEDSKQADAEGGDSAAI